MRKMKVSIEVPPTTGGTGTCVVLITEDAQRTMLTHLGVSATLSPDDIREDEIRKAKYIYVEGYLFTGENQKAAALKAIDLAKKHNVKVAFTVSDPFLIQLFRDEFWALIEGPVDLLFCNLEEARSLTGFVDPIDCAAGDSPPRRKRRPHIRRRWLAADARRAGDSRRKRPRRSHRHHGRRRHVRSGRPLRHHLRPHLETSRPRRLPRRSPHRRTIGGPHAEPLYAGGD